VGRVEVASEVWEEIGLPHAELALIFLLRERDFGLNLPVLNGIEKSLLLTAFSAGTFR
jgi:8-oxo-dGTP pyrophosphatase MutT (NUDIX family)